MVAFMSLMPPHKLLRVTATLAAGARIVSRLAFLF
jgi:hypothetical protein